MTANLKVEIAQEQRDVLRVPNAALRFRPTADMFAALNQAVPPEAHAAARSRRTRQTGGPGRAATATAAPATARRRLAVRIGAADQGAAGRHRHGAGMPAAAPLRSGVPVPSGGRRGSAAADGGVDPRRGMLERFKGMSPDEQKQFIARMKDRGQDTSVFEKELQTQTPKRPSGAPNRKNGAPSAQTIDALFAPLPPVRVARPRLAVRGQAAQAGEPPPRHHRRHQHRAAQRRAAAGHGSGHQRHRRGDQRRRRPGTGNGNPLLPGRTAAGAAA